MTPSLRPDLLESLARAVEGRFGLHFPPERWTDLARGVSAAALESKRGDLETYALEAITGSLPPAAVEVLASNLTIGETYFFRDPAAFTALETCVLPELRRKGKTRLLIWSAGCCSGEEPYSIAIALRRALPDLEDWRVSILATDVNARFLEKAERGIYSRWSFRGVSEEIKSVYFRATPEGLLKVAPDIRAMVKFAPLNLVEDVYPSVANGTAEIDVVFCRNALIYFSHEQARRVIARFHRALSAEGWLFVSAAEAPADLFTGFVPMEFPGTMVFGKGAANAKPDASAPLPSPAPVSAPSPQLPSRIEPAADVARRLADAGRFEDALAVCDRALEEEKLNAGLHHLRAVILEQTGAVGEAIAALKRALFLDHRFVAAHLTLGHLLQREGQRTEAERCFVNACSILSGSPPEMVFPDAGGMTAARLLAIVNAMKGEAA